MRIGVFPYLYQPGGGIYQYSLTILHALKDWQSEDELVLIVNGRDKVPASLNLRNWIIKTIPTKSSGNKHLDVLRRAVGEGPHRDIWRLLRKKIGQFHTTRGPARNLNVVQVRSDLNQLFHDWKLELALYAWPTPLSFETEIPFVMAIHDVQHRLHPEFPEVSENGEWEGREYSLRNVSRHATLVLADSEIGKEDILGCYGDYGLTADRVKVLPFLPAPYLNENVSQRQIERVRSRYHLPERYLFYPAQFWPHKNHLRIVQALGKIRQHYGLHIPIVFSGSHNDEIRKKTFRQVTRLSSRLGLDKEIRHFDYVPDEDMAALYAEAAALVMPTFFGPTNIPILEAWAYECPVLTSDVRGIREQVGDAALLVDPTSVPALADGIYRLWTDEILRTNLKALGRQRLSRYGPDDFRSLLVSAIEQAKVSVRGNRVTRAS